MVSGTILIKGHFKKQWPFLVQMVLLTLSALMFFLFLSSLAWQAVFGLLFLGALSFFIFSLYQFFNQPRLAKPHALEKTVPWLNFIISYWSLTVIGAVLGSDPLEYPFFLSLILVFALFFWLGYYQTSLKGHAFKSLKSDLLIISLVLTQVYLVMNFLPLGFYLNALSLSILYGIIKFSSDKIEHAGR